MSNKILVFIMLVFISFSLSTSVLNLDKIRKTGEFKIKRDLFNSFKSFDKNEMSIKKNDIKKVEKEQKTEKKFNIEEEVKNNIIYSGYSLKKNKYFAVITVAGEVFIVQNGDVVLNKIKIIEIKEDEIIVEVENIKFNIKISGDENEIKV